MAKLTQEQRDKMSSKLFALPSRKMFPIEDEKHVRLAWDMVDKAKGLTEAEREEARRRILKRAKELGIDTSNWDKKLKASEGEETESLALHAASSNISLDELEHPNRMPFRGILTYFDVPSDRAPGGASGMKVVIPSDVGIPALSSLKGMAVNFSDGWSGHDPTQKIGVITDAYPGDPQEDGAVPVFVEGFIYAHDFQDVAFEIKANQSQLGFSYETAMTRLEPGEFNGEPVLIVKELGYFTGASILLKASAAYQKTSIAANAEEEGGLKVEEFKELMASALGELKDELKKYVEEKLEALKEAIEKPEEKPAEAEVKTEEKAAEAKAEEAHTAEVSEVAEVKEVAEDKGEGELKASADLVEELKALREELAALKASKAEEAADHAPERKSVAFPRTLMAKYAMDEEDDVEKAMKAISAREDLDVEQRMALKLELLDKKRRQQ